LAYGEDSEKDGAKMAWQAWLGFYNSHTKKLNLNKEQLVQMSAEYARAMGLPQLPAIQKQTIGKMGLQVQYNLRCNSYLYSNPFARYSTFVPDNDTKY
jgi:hypothetical protein